MPLHGPRCVEMMNFALKMINFVIKNDELPRETIYHHLILNRF